MVFLHTLLHSSRFWLSLIVILLCLGVWLLVRYLFRRLEAARRLNEGVRFFGIGLRYVVIIFGFVSVLQINGVNVSSLVAGLGIVGIIVGFALQDILKDLVMGTTIAAHGFFATGDVVRYGDIEGTVVDFSIRATKLRSTQDGSLYTIANRNIDRIQVLSDWVDVIVPGPYSVPAEQMRAVCREICRRVAQLEAVSACEFLGTQALEASQISYLLRLHCPPAQQAQARRDALGILQDTLAEAHIEIPYNQLDVHLPQPGAFTEVSPCPTP